MKKMIKGSIAAVMLFGASAMPVLLGGTVANATGSSPIAGTVYVLDGENMKIWAIANAGGTPVQFADLSSLQDSCQSTPYPWESAVSGTTMYWVDDSCGDIYATNLITGITTDIYLAAQAPMYDEGYLTLDAAGNIWEQGNNGAKLLELTAGTYTPHYYDVTGGTTNWGGMAYYNGYVYYGIGSSNNATIYKFQIPATPGSVSSIAVTTVATSVPNAGGGMAVDTHGNIFTSNGTQVYEIPSGSSTSTEVAQTCANQGIESMKFYRGNLYFSAWKPGVVCEFNKTLTATTVLYANPDPTSRTGFNPEGMGIFGSESSTNQLQVKVYFALGSSHVTYTAVGQLNWFKAQLKAKGATNVKITVTGYVQPTAGKSTDVALGQARANGVVAALKKLKVAATFTAHSGGLKSLNVADSRVATVVATW